MNVKSLIFIYSEVSQYCIKNVSKYLFSILANDRQKSFPQNVCLVIF